MKNGQLEKDDNVRRIREPNGELGVIEAIGGGCALVRWESGSAGPIAESELQFVPGHEWKSYVL